MYVKKIHLSLSLALGLLALAGTLALLWTMSSGPPIAQAQSVARPSPSHAIAATAGVTIHVSSVSGVDTTGCGGEANPCATIQYAVDLATSGDEIHIATFDVSSSGMPPSVITSTARYTGTGSDIVDLNESITLRGGYAYAHVTGFPTAWLPGLIPAPVDGQHARRPLHVSGDITPSLELLAFINGHADRGGNVYAEDARVRFVATPMMSGTATYGGGGLYLKNCSISFDPGDVTWENVLGLGGLIPVRNNTAQYGGGVYIESGTPVLAGVAIISNAATADGGGFYLNGGQPVIAGGLVLENQAGERGGGFFLGDSPARIAGVAVYSNTATDGAGFYLDGPFAFSEERIPIIANSYVRHNRTTGSQGGGFYFHQTIAGLVNNVIADNQASDGAAMYLWASSPQLFHNTIAQNTGSTGAYLTNKPGQILPPVIPIPSRPSFTNTIVSTHTVGFYVESTGLSGILQNQATLEGTLWWGNGNDTAGPGPVVHTTDVYSDPLFTCTGDPPDCRRPYHILTDSAAVDAGVVVALTIPGSDLFVDIDLQLRPSGEGYDIGADEVVSDSYSVWLVPPISALAAEPGQTVTHTHQLMNTGRETDTYDLAFHSDSGWAELLTGNPITLSPQTSDTVQVQVNVPATATNEMRDTALITATSRADIDRQASALDVTAVITGDVTDLSVGKWADVEDAVEPGEAVRFTIVVTNNGPLTDTLVVTLTDTAVPTRAIGAWSLPPGCTGDIATGVAVCTRTLAGGSVPVSESLTLVITTTDTYTGPLVNRVSASADVIDPDPANNVAYATVGLTTPVCIPLENVAIHGPTKWISGTPFGFRANVSPPLATSPIVYAWSPQPDGSVVLPGHSVATYTWHTTGTKTITVTATNCDGAGQATNVHTITIYGPETTLVDLIVDKRADVTTTQAGGMVHYTIAITKSGSLTGALAVTLTDTIVPTSALTMLRWPDNCTGTLATGVITCTWDLPGAAPLITRTFTIAVTTTNVYSGWLNNTAIVEAAALDPDPANNVAQATVQVSTSTPPEWNVYLPLVLRNN